MVIAKVSVSGVIARPTYRSKIPQGIVGATVEFDYTDPMWAGLKKTVIFWSSAVKDILDVGESVVVPPEVVAKAGCRLRVGIYGEDLYGNVIIPTLWADIGPVMSSANPGLNSSGNNDLDLTQLQKQIGDLSELQTKTKENLVAAINELAQNSGAALPGVVKSVNGVMPDDNGNVNLTIPEAGGTVTDEQLAKAVADYFENNPATGGITKAEKDLILSLFRNAAYISADMGDTLAQLEALWDGSGEETEPDEPGGDVHTHSYSSKVTTAATCTTAGVRTYTCSCGHSYTQTIPATGHKYVDGVCTVCGVADPTYNPDVPEPEVTLTRISASYSGGDVAVGTSVNDLTGVVVTAHYSNGTSATVTGYTLSGTIAEGNNTITVSYGGKTTTFVVVGVAAESGGSDAVNLFNGSYVKHSGLTNVEINGNVISYDAPEIGTATFTIEGLEAGKQYTIFVESNSEDGGAAYTQCTVNKTNGAVYTEQLVKFNVDWAASGPNYATFTASSAMMYFWCCEGTALPTGYPGVSDITLTVYIYEGTLTERP